MIVVIYPFFQFLWLDSCPKFAHGVSNTCYLISPGSSLDVLFDSPTGIDLLSDGLGRIHFCVRRLASWGLNFDDNQDPSYFSSI